MAKTINLLIVASATIALLGVFGGDALAVTSISSSGGGTPGVALDGSTRVAKLKVPPGTYTISSSGTIRNDDATNVAYVECSLENDGGPVSGSTSDFVAPIALSPGVSGGAIWSLSGTFSNTSNSPARIFVSCSNFGPAADNKVQAWFWTMVAIPVTKDTHTDYP